MSQLLFRGASLANTARVVEGVRLPPPGFRWDFNAYPINISGVGASFSHDFVPEKYHSPALSGPTYFVDGVNGNDTHTGLTNYTNAVATINKAITLGNATNAPYNVMIKPGIYARSNGFNGVSPTQKAAFIADGGRVVTGTFDVLGWGAHDGTYTNTYSVSRSNVNRVFDLLNKDSYGNYVELTNVATPTLCNTTVGTWAQSGSTLYVNRTDGAAVTSANTRAYLGTVNIINLTNPVDLLLTGTTKASGFDFEGGGYGGLVSLTAGTANIMASNCTFKYSGGVILYNPVKGVRIDNLNGLMAFVNCEASCNSDDGFNAHYSTATTGQCYFLLINCIGNNNGRGNSTSNNGLTFHETVRCIDINGSYDGNYGGTVHNIGNSQGWYVGTRASRSFGDVSLGGGIYSTEFICDNTSENWMDSTMAFAAAGGTAVAAWTTGKIHLHKHVTGLGSTYVNAGAAIDTY